MFHFRYKLFFEKYRQQHKNNIYIVIFINKSIVNSRGSTIASAMERYCSSYYDRHGLYNDGFPCPGQTYCCEKDDGHKMCCSEDSLVLDTPPHQQDELQSVASSTIIQQIMNNQSPNNFNNHKYNFRQNQQQHGQIGVFKPGQHQSNVAVSSISFLMSK